MALIIGVQAWNVVPDMFEHDKYPDYYHFVLPFVYGCDVEEFGMREGHITRNSIKWWLNCASWEVFGNPNTIPIIFNIGVMPLVYLLGYYITNDRMVGLISLVAFSYNPLYKGWITSGTYDMVWAFFLLLGIILVIKKTRFAILGYAASILSKTLAILYLPMYLYTIWQAPMNLRARVLHAGIAVALIAAGGVLLSGVDLIGSEFGFREDRVLNAVFSNFFTLWQVLPFLLGVVVLGMIFKPKHQTVGRKLVWVWLIGMLVLNPLPMVFSEQMQYSYRMVPFAAFMSVLIGMILVDAGTFIVERKMSKPIKNIH